MRFAPGGSFDYVIVSYRMVTAIITHTVGRGTAIWTSNSESVESKNGVGKVWRRRLKSSNPFAVTCHTFEGLPKRKV